MKILLVAGGELDIEVLKKVYNGLDKPYGIGVDRGTLILLEKGVAHGFNREFFLREFVKIIQGFRHYGLDVLKVLLCNLKIVHTSNSLYLI